MLNNLLGFLIDVFYGSERYKNHRRQAARRRGLEYALVEIYETKNLHLCLDRLEAEATHTISGDSEISAFDLAILEVVRAASLRTHKGLLTQ